MFCSVLSAFSFWVFMLLGGQAKEGVWCWLRSLIPVAREHRETTVQEGGEGKLKGMGVPEHLSVMPGS